jgi:hypothetical protein
LTGLEELLKPKGNIFKTVMPKTDELDLPMFIKARREKYAIALLGKEVAYNQRKAQIKYENQAKDKPQRKLVIIETKSQFKDQQVPKPKSIPITPHRR